MENGTGKPVAETSKAASKTAAKPATRKATKPAAKKATKKATAKPAAKGNGKFDPAKVVALYKAGKKVVEIAMAMGYEKGTGQNRCANVLVKAGIYKGFQKLAIKRPTIRHHSPLENSGLFHSTENAREPLA